MQALEKRIAALEMANPPADEKTFVIRLVAPGHVDAEIDGLRAYDGQQWTRLPGETERALIDRATIEVKRNEWGVAQLIGSSL